MSDLSKVVGRNILRLAAMSMVGVPLAQSLFDRGSHERPTNTGNTAQFA